MLKIINRIILGLCIFIGVHAIIINIIISENIAAFFHIMALTDPVFIFSSICFLAVAIIYALVSLIVHRILHRQKLQIKNYIVYILICVCSILSWFLWYINLIMIA